MTFLQRTGNIPNKTVFTLNYLCNTSQRRHVVEITFPFHFTLFFSFAVASRLSDNCLDHSGASWELSHLRFPLYICRRIHTSTIQLEAASAIHSHSSDHIYRYIASFLCLLSRGQNLLRKKKSNIHFHFLLRALIKCHSHTLFLAPPSNHCAVYRYTFC